MLIIIIGFIKYWMLTVKFFTSQFPVSKFLPEHSLLSVMCFLRLRTIFLISGYFIKMSV